jgi:hypothetical protein
MSQRSIVLYLARTGLTAMKIDSLLVVTLGLEATGYSSVTRVLRQTKFPSPNQPTPFSDDNPALDDSNEVILLPLTEQPFASLRQLSRLGHLP